MYLCSKSQATTLYCYSAVYIFSFFLSFHLYFFFQQFTETLRTYFIHGQAQVFLIHDRNVHSQASSHKHSTGQNHMNKENKYSSTLFCTKFLFSFYIFWIRVIFWCKVKFLFNSGSILDRFYCCIISDSRKTD